MLGLLREGAASHGYATNDPSVQVALVELAGSILNTVCFRALGDDLRYDLRQWRRGSDGR